jgi:hypothetical protein
MCKLGRRQGKGRICCCCCCCPAPHGRLVLQMLLLPGMGVAAPVPSADGSLYIASSSDGGIRQLKPVPLERQARLLAAAGDFQAALELLTLLEEEDDEHHPAAEQAAGGGWGGGVRQQRGGGRAGLSVLLGVGHLQQPAWCMFVFLYDGHSLVSVRGQQQPPTLMPTHPPTHLLLSTLVTDILSPGHPHLQAHCAELCWSLGLLMQLAAQQALWPLTVSTVPGGGVAALAGCPPWAGLGWAGLVKQHTSQSLSGFGNLLPATLV